MSLAQIRLLIKLLVHGPFEVRTSAVTARACARYGWVDLIDGWDEYQISTKGVKVLEELVPEVVQLQESNVRLTRKLLDLEAEKWQ